MTEAEYIIELKKNKRKLKDDLIALPFEEKIRRVVEMQKVSREANKDKNKIIYFWNLE